MTAADKARALIAHPAALGHALGYKDLRENLHGRWIRQMVMGDGDMTLQAHRGSYKTTCLCIAIALLMIRYPDRNIIFLRKTDNDITEVIGAVSKILSSDVMRDIYEALTGCQLAVAQANNAEVTLSTYSAPRGAAQLLGIGINGSLTGKHADIIITDDIINLKDRISRAERDHTKSIYMELQNVRNRGGRMINTGTPWHKDDAFSLMPKPQKFDCYSTGLLTEAKIDELRQSMTPSLFAANYELRHIAAENALFSTAPVFTPDAAFLHDGIAHIDAAYGGEDFTAFTCGKRHGDKLYMYGRLWHKHVDTVIDACIAESKRLMCEPIHAEKNADKGYLIKEINERGGHGRLYSEFENKYIKISTFLRKWWPNIVWLQGTDADYLAQIMDYTEDAEHDDAADGAACICRYYDMRG